MPPPLSHPTRGGGAPRGHGWKTSGGHEHAQELKAHQLVVEVRLKHDHRIVDSKMTNDAVWKEYIHPEFSRRVSSGELAASDARDVGALKARWDVELAEFRLWCDVANRAHEISGVLWSTSTPSRTKTRACAFELSANAPDLDWLD